MAHRRRKREPKIAEVEEKGGSVLPKDIAGPLGHEPDSFGEGTRPQSGRRNVVFVEASRKRGREHPITLQNTEGRGKIRV